MLIRHPLCLSHLTNQIRIFHTFILILLYQELFLRREVIPLVSLQYGPRVACLEVKLEDIAENNVLDIPSWTFHTPVHLCDLTYNKSETNLEYNNL